MTAPYHAGPPYQHGPQYQQGPQYQPGPPYAPGPPYQAGPSYSPSPPAPPRRTGPLLVGAALGAVLVVLIGVVLGLTGVLGFGADSTDVDTTPVAMPETLGGYPTVIAASAARGGSPDQITALQERWGRTAALTGSAYSAAFGGAGVGVQGYADDELVFLPTVVAVRAGAPGPTTGIVPDPADLGLAVNQSEVVIDGDVQCVIFQSVTVVAGETPDPDDAVTSLCQRTGASFTVYVSAGGASGDEGRAKMVELTDAAYETLSAG